MQRFDLAVVGSGIGGLAVAALVSSRRKKVVLFTSDETAGGSVKSFSRGGYQFYPCPSLTFGFEPGGFFNRICSEIGIPLPSGVLAPEYQIALPDRRITISADAERTMAELRREFPGEIDKIAACYRDAGRILSKLKKSRWHAYYYSRKRTASFISAYRFSKEFSSCLNVQTQIFFSQPLEDLPLPRFVTMLFTAPVALRSGFAPYIDHFVKAIKKTGGDVRMGHPAPELKYRRRSFAELETMNGAVESSAILFNMPAQARQRTLLYAIQSPVVPVGMANDVMYLPDYEHPNEYITLALSLPEDASAAPAGARTLTATFHGRMAAAIQNDASEPLRGAVRRVVPFVDEYTQFIEEYHPAGYEPPLPAGTSCSTLLALRTHAILSKISPGNVYLLPDDPWTPLHTAAGARQVAERVS